MQRNVRVARERVQRVPRLGRLDDGLGRRRLGTLANLQRHVPLDGVDALVVSHEHPDHWSDLEGFFNVCRFVTEREGIPVYAPAGLKGRTYNDDESPYFEWRDIKD